MKRMFVVLLVTCVGLSVLGEGASARKRFRDREKTEIVEVTNVDDTSNQVVQSFSGKLFSKRPKCVAARTIEIVQASNGAPFGTAQSETDGDWTVSGEGPSEGTVYTISIDAVTRNRIRCLGDSIEYIAT